MTVCLFFIAIKAMAGVKNDTDTYNNQSHYHLNLLAIWALCYLFDCYSSIENKQIQGSTAFFHIWR